MRRPEHQQRIPEWAQKERESDLAWIRDNLHVLWPIAVQQYADGGRGAIFIDTLTKTAHATGSGNPMFYVTEDGIEMLEQHLDALRMVRTYDPASEFVSVLLRDGRESTYRVSVPATIKIS